MKKLTAERCKERITHLSRAKRMLGVSMAEEDYLEALEIALPVLEQQEITGEGWIEWGGGERPVAAQQVVDVKWRAGGVMTVEAGGRSWIHDGKLYDIIAYRVIEQQERPANQNGEQ